ncbi:MAG: UvrD-helicase domain-containing protein [Chlorobi bacterium]|nr:UvrD-helicase domain-containing protein [Chlorobiota bacterium]
MAEQKLSKLLNGILEYYELNKVNYFTAKQILENIHTLGILSDLLARARNYSFENSLFLLSDSTKLLKEIISDNDTPFIYEKAGVWYKHIMIDEFQDTSGLQWNNFKPLILNSLSENGFNLVVGDVKQSIYRWRNGDWQLLAEKLFEEIKPFRINDNLQLNTNWRSSKNIVLFNNYIFKYAPNILENIIFTNIEGAKNSLDIENLKGKIENAYNNVTQNISPVKSNECGYIECNFYQDLTKNDWEQEVLKSIPKTINKLINNNYELKDIVILVRKKYHAKLIVDYFQKINSTINHNNEFNYPVVSDEALYLNSSPIINFIISCIIFLNNPEDELNNLKLIADYKVYVKNEIEFPKYNENNVEDSLPNEFINSLNKLKELPLFDLTERLIQIFHLNKISGQLSYLVAFQDTINEFIETYHGDKLGFIEWWEDEGKSKTLTFPSDLNAVRIITIHKAKGLEFNAVILPFLNWSIDHEKYPIIWCKPTDKQFDRIPILPMQYKSSLTSTIFYRNYINEKLLAFVDNLNLLYVALTRAKNTLIVTGIIKSNNDKIKNVSDLVYSILKMNKDINLTKNEFNKNEISQIQFSYGQLKVNTAINKHETSNELILNDFYSNYPYSKLDIKQTDSDIFEKQQDNKIQAISYGKLMHKIMEKIIYKNDIEKAVKDIFLEGFITEYEINDTIVKIKSYLGQPGAKNWFNNNLNVKNETSILLPDGTLHRPDRVIFGKNETIIIDYKFTKEVSNEHKKQLLEYAKYLNTMNYNSIKSYLWYPEMHKIVMV